MQPSFDEGTASFLVKLSLDINACGSQHLRTTPGFTARVLDRKHHMPHARVDEGLRAGRSFSGVRAGFERDDSCETRGGVSVSSKPRQGHRFSVGCS